MRASAITIVAVCAVASSPAAANLIVNGGFEDGVFGGGGSLSEQVLPGDGTTLPGWTVGPSGPLTWYENGFNLQQIALTAHTGDFALNLNDGSVRFVSVSQTIATLPFREYEVSYWIGNYSANNGPASIGATIVDGTSNTIIFSETGTAPATSSSTWVRQSFRFISDGTSNTITFTEGDGLTYIGLDDVRVTSVPEPATWAMMLAGFAGLGLAGCRRSRRTVHAA